MSSRRSAKGQMDLDGVQPKQKILPEAPGRSLHIHIHIRSRNHPNIHPRVLDEPTRSNSRVSSTRSSFACNFKGTFAISSRNRVPCPQTQPPHAIDTRVGKRSLRAQTLALKYAFDNPPAFTVTIGVLAARERV